MKMIDHNHFICHLILGTFTEYPERKEGHIVFKICTKNLRICTNFQKRSRRFFRKSPTFARTLADES